MAGIRKDLHLRQHIPADTFNYFTRVIMPGLPAVLKAISLISP
jgi:hypothetical protein